MRTLTHIFLKGLAVVLPLVVTVAIVYWAGSAAESTLGGLLRRVIPPERYVTGLGVVAGVGVIFGIGVLMNLWFARRLLILGERLIGRIPLVKSIYGAVRDLMGFMSSSKERGAADQVVLVAVDGGSAHLIGLVTRDDLSDLSADYDAADRVAVYLPMSYQIGGFTVFVPRDRVTPIDMSVEDGLRFAMTAGVSTTKPAPPGSVPTDPG